MIQLNFEELIQVVQTLKPEQKVKLAKRLQWPPLALEPTREQLIKELENLRTLGAFDPIESLYGKFAKPTVPDVNQEELNAYLHEVATEWEQELDEFYGNDN